MGQGKEKEMNLDLYFSVDKKKSDLYLWWEGGVRVGSLPMPLKHRLVTSPTGVDTRTSPYLSVTAVLRCRQRLVRERVVLCLPWLRVIDVTCRCKIKEAFLSTRIMSDRGRVGKGKTRTLVTRRVGVHHAISKFRNPTLYYVLLLPFRICVLFR